MLSGCIAAVAVSIAATDPLSSATRVSELKCRSISGADADRYHLNADEREQIAIGTWGRSIAHPLDPNYYRVNRDRREEKRDLPCRPKT
jgi:hypothetical protein